MLRSDRWPPRLHVHKGFARVCWGSKWYHLGRAGSDSARAAYTRLIGVWRVDPYYDPDGPGLTVRELCREYLAAAPFPPGNRLQYGRAVRLLAGSHEGVTVEEFGPVKLAAWQRALAAERDDAGKLRFSRGYVGKLVRIVRAVWRWGVATERVRVDQWQALLSVRGLRYDEGRSGRTVSAAPDADFRRMVVELSDGSAGLARLLRLTGARPSELFSLRPADVDRTTDPWSYAPVFHKTAAAGKERVIYFGPGAVGVLNQFQQAHQNLPYFTNRKGRTYTRNSLLLAFKRACRRAGVPVITPYQLRHARLTEVRTAVGIEGAQAVGGHSGLKVTEVYTKRRNDLAARVAGESG